MIIKNNLQKNKMNNKEYKKKFGIHNNSLGRCLCLRKHWVVHYYTRISYKDNSNKIEAFVYTCKDCAKQHRKITIVQYRDDVYE